MHEDLFVVTHLLSAENVKELHKQLARGKITETFGETKVVSDVGKGQDWARQVFDIDVWNRAVEAYLRVGF